MNRDRYVCGQRPWRGRPDDDGERLVVVCDAEAVQQIRSLCIVCSEADVDRRGDVVFVLDLGFCQRRFVVDAPEGGAEALVELLLFRQVGERFDDGRFEFGGDRHVRGVVAAEDAHAEDGVALAAQPVEGALFAFGAELERVDVVEVEF